MWFKRRKRSEQDHALSESLKSLQTLLSDTGRMEPSLGPEGTDDNAPQPVPGAAARRRAPPPASEDDAGYTDNERGDVRPRPPASPTTAGNRWKDLNLSFDTEPAPRPRATSDDESEPAPQTAAPDEPDEPDEPDVPDAPDAPDAARRTDSDAGDTTPPPDAEPTTATDSPSGSVSPFPVGEAKPWKRAPDLDLAEFSVPPETGRSAAGSREAAPPADERDAAALAAAAAGPDPHEIFAVSAQDEHESAGEENPLELDEEENQLHLELETADDDDNDIPTLTEAVYLPEAETVLQQPAPESDDSSRTRDIEQCLDRLRMRLQLTGKELLSPEQEAELRETLADLIDELRRD